jgi:protein-disulfide isomerase
VGIPVTPLRKRSTLAAPRSRTPLVLGIVGGIACLGLVLLLVVGGVIGYLVLQGESEPEAGPGASAGLTAPPGVADDQPYLELSTSTDGPVVDVHLDFQCPHCKTFEEIHGADLQEMAEAGEITLRMHPRPMLDASSSPPGYSGRAANAAVCAYAEDPAQWHPAATALFAEQPGPEGLPDEELVGIVQEATSLDITECQAAGTYLPWLEEVVEPDAQSTVSGTPAVLIDGEQFTGDLSSPGALREAVEAA